MKSKKKKVQNRKSVIKKFVKQFYKKYGEMMTKLANE